MAQLLENTGHPGKLPYPPLQMRILLRYSPSNCSTNNDWEVKPNLQNMQYRELKASPTHQCGPQSQLNLVDPFLTSDGWSGLWQGPSSQTSLVIEEWRLGKKADLLKIIAACGDGKKWTSLRAEGVERGSGQKRRINNSGTVCSYQFPVFLISYGISQMKKPRF